ncbi:MAG TPA: DUF92 domain-containing protein [Vicinamibacterales bacterium]|jgi:uncharacterized protein (TIGR00297 family)
MTSFSETRRQTLHMSMAAFALLLRFLTWWQAALCAVVAFLFNLFVLPRLAQTALYRPGDAARGYPLGILFYPLSVLLLILAFPRRPDVVAAAWGILAFGDGFATIVGTRRRRRALPWNPDKTVAGSVAFMVAGSVAGIALAWWTRPAVAPLPPLLFTIGAPILAAVAAGLVESLPVRLDDNISVPITAGIVLGGLALITPESCTAARTWLPQGLLYATLVNVPIAALGWRARTVNGAGAVIGAIIGVTIFACAGPAGWLLLFASFLAAIVSTRLGVKRKSVLGIAEERGGRRGPGNAIANTGLAAFAAVIAGLSPYREGALLVMVAALTAGASDTVASEIGKAWGTRTYLFPTFTRVRPGTSGAISLEGTGAGLVAALALAALGLSLGLVKGNGLWFAAIGATAGSFVESSLGATLESSGTLNNDMLNFINTALAAAFAVALAWMFVR